MTYVVATAGHVDHGKSTLVRALTGMEPDRLDEERRRGLSIELGFAWTTWPDVGDVAFVDVPGHRRFVRTTLAGLGLVPVVLLVVAANEGWMAQTAEHVAALDALGVDRGLLVITKTDRGDPAAAVAQARTALAGTSLAGIDDVGVCAPDGTGLTTLRHRLVGVLRSLAPAAADAPVRLWVDRSFSIAGAGRVVTGTLPAGTITVGAELATTSGAVVRVRGLETLGRGVDTVAGPARVAANVRSRRPLARGDVLLTPGAYLATTQVDVSLRPPVRLGATAVLHIGTTAVACRVRRLGDNHVRLGLAGPLPLRVGDRAVLRDPGRPGAMVGTTVLDVRPPRLTGRGAASRRVVELARLLTPADVAAHVVSRGPVATTELAAMGLSVDEGVAVVPGWRVGARRWAELTRELAELVAADARRDPLAPARLVAAIAVALELPDRALVRPLAAAAGLRVAHGAVLPPVGATPLPAAVTAAVGRLDTWFADHPFAAPTSGQLHDLGLDDTALAAAARDGRVLRLASTVVLGVGAEDAAYEVLAGLPSPFRVTDACAALDTTRRTAVPLLERLDRHGRTRLVSDGRRVVVRSRAGADLRSMPGRTSGAASADLTGAFFAEDA